MERVSLTKFTDEVLLAVKDCPIEIAENYIRIAAIDFCKRAQVVQYTIQVPLWANVHRYLLDAPPGEEIVSILRHDVGGTCGAPTLLECGYHLTDNVLILTRAPSADIPAGVSFTVATRPAQDACDVDARLYRFHHDAIVNGAIAKLLSVPSMPWYNAVEARRYGEKASRDIAAAGVDRIVGPNRGRIKIHHGGFM